MNRNTFLLRPPPVLYHTLTSFYCKVLLKKNLNRTTKLPRCNTASKEKFSLFNIQSHLQWVVQNKYYYQKENRKQKISSLTSIEPERGAQKKLDQCCNLEFIMWIAWAIKNRSFFRGNGVLWLWLISQHESLCGAWCAKRTGDKECLQSWFITKSLISADYRLDKL